MVDTFVIYDLIFLAAFTLVIAIFLYTRKHNLQRQGLLYLYRTKWGIKFIDRFTKKYQKLLKSLQYIIIGSGFVLMAGMIWMLVKFSWMYLTTPFVAEQIKVPILMPLIPYLPKLFKIDFLPPFYFTYWIIIIAIIAIPHEFAHGIFARLNNLKIHSTGFGFLGPFLAAFVEPDEKKMFKSSKKAQMTILAAGTFANVLTAVLFTLVIWILFITSFVPAGVVFNSYATSVLDTSQITHLNNTLFTSPSQIDALIDEELIEITADNTTYYTTPLTIKYALDNDAEQFLAYDNSPAFNARLSGVITHFNGKPVHSYNELSNEILLHNPGDEVTITTLKDKKSETTTLNLAEREGRPYLGIGIVKPSAKGISGYIFAIVSKVKDPTIYYKSKLGEFGIFIYDLLWWIILICFSVALVNMIPVGIFDGGRFFYLTIWAITGKEKTGKKAFALSTWLILLLVALLMFKWLMIFF